MSIQLDSIIDGYIDIEDEGLVRVTIPITERVEVVYCIGWKHVSRSTAVKRLDILDFIGEWARARIERGDCPERDCGRITQNHVVTSDQNLRMSCEP